MEEGDEFIAELDDLISDLEAALVAADRVGAGGVTAQAAFHTAERAMHLQLRLAKTLRKWLDGGAPG